MSKEEMDDEKDKFISDCHQPGCSYSRLLY